MKERPILFSAQMVRAILAGHKTQTRRVVKLDREKRAHPELSISMRGDGDARIELWPDTGRAFGNFARTSRLACPYGVPGDRLWVREAHWLYGRWRKNGKTSTGRQRWRFVATYGHNVQANSGEYVRFQAPDRKPAAEELGFHRRPSIHMPRWASRITLEITGVRVERLQDISESDARAEGGSGSVGVAIEMGLEPFTAIDSFRAIWESINGPESWDANPWVWVVEFTRLKGGAA